mmetsp:Transcript_17158/g.38609  ORF Transcript_17158/g.38609 Transcript_17158/m.38609 type:complete len:298 (-) Transcript_17158:71-964(-)
MSVASPLRFGRVFTIDTSSSSVICGPPENNENPKSKDSRFGKIFPICLTPCFPSLTFRGRARFLIFANCGRLRVFSSKVIFKFLLLFVSPEVESRVSHNLTSREDASHDLQTADAFTSSRPLRHWRTMLNVSSGRKIVESQKAIGRRIPSDRLARASALELPSSCWMTRGNDRSSFFATAEDAVAPAGRSRIRLLDTSRAVTSSLDRFTPHSASLSPLGTSGAAFFFPFFGCCPRGFVPPACLQLPFFFLGAFLILADVLLDGEFFPGDSLLSASTRRFFLGMRPSICVFLVLRWME